MIRGQGNGHIRYIPAFFTAIPRGQHPPFHLQVRAAFLQSRVDRTKNREFYNSQWPFHQPLSLCEMLHGRCFPKPWLPCPTNFLLVSVRPFHGHTRSILSRGLSFTQNTAYVKTASRPCYKQKRPQARWVLCSLSLVPQSS